MYLEMKKYVAELLVRCPSIKFFGDFGVKLNRLEFSPRSKQGRPKAIFSTYIYVNLIVCNSTISFNTQKFLYQNDVKICNGNVQLI